MAGYMKLYSFFLDVRPKLLQAFFVAQKEAVALVNTLAEVFYDAN